MSEALNGSNEPFIVYRNPYGVWYCDFVQNQYGETFEWVADVQEKDPFAMIFTSDDFSDKSFSNVYDRVMLARFRNEYNIDPPVGANPNELEALINLFDDYIEYLPLEATDYLLRHDRPLALLYEMNTLNIVSNDPRHDYNKNKATEFIDLIERLVAERLKNKSKDIIDDSGTRKLPNPEYYQDINRVRINNGEVILAENLRAELRYLVMEKRFTESYNASGDNVLSIGYTNDYLEAMIEFAEKVQQNVDCVKTRRETLQSLYGVEPLTLTAAHCVQDGLADGLKGKLIILKPEALDPEEHTADHQLRICTGGLGSQPGAFEGAVFSKDLFYGSETCYERNDILGVANINRLPKWAKTKYAERQAERGSTRPIAPDNTNTKPGNVQENVKKSIFADLENAKREVAKLNAGQGKPANNSQPRKRGSRRGEEL
jgi:hypothetical protein